MLSYQKANPIKSHKTTIFLWFSYGFPKALGEHLVLREGHHLLRKVAEPRGGGTRLVAHHVFGGDGIAQNLQSLSGESRERPLKGLEKMEV